MKLPWKQPELRDWMIVGMNHYRAAGKRCLFVAMTRAGRCIQAEGNDEAQVFVSLSQQASRLNTEIERRHPSIPSTPEAREWAAADAIERAKDHFPAGLEYR